MDTNNPSSENYHIEKLSPELLRCYIDMRKKIDVEANSIHCITSMLMHYRHYGHDHLKIDPNALGEVNQIMNDNILNIWEILNDFIHIEQAKAELEQIENKTPIN